MSKLMMRDLIHRSIYFLALGLLLGACKNNSQTNYTDEFIIEDGFEIQLVAAEPLLRSPVAMDFDLKGRLWVVEMTGYMRDIDGSEEELADGRISILADTDGDGVMDSKKVFLDNLVLPRALKLYRDGLLYAEPPNLWWTPIRDDDLPGERVLVDSMYTNGGNVEHMPNGLLYNMDNWIYNAKSDRRYRYHNGEWIVSPTIFRGQWGITNDQMGRLFYNDNSNPLFGDYIMPNSFDQNAFLKKKKIVHQRIPPDRRVYPLQATAVNRGYQEGVLDGEGKLINFTSACGPLIYKGGQFDPSYQGNAFVCGPEVNLVKRYTIRNSRGKITAEHVDTIMEFLVSRSETFRPVNLYDAPDGSMYVVDMRKGIIQHRAYMTTYLIDRLRERGLDNHEDGGRIYKVVKKGTEPNSYDYTSMTVKDWIALLDSPHYWERIKAQEVVIQKAGSQDIIDIRALLTSASPEGRLHVFWTLEGLNALKGSDVEQIILESSDPVLVTTALRFLPQKEKELDGDVAGLISKAVELDDPNVDMMLANISGQLERRYLTKTWKDIAQKYREHPHFAEALASGLSSGEGDYLSLIRDWQEDSYLSTILTESRTNRNNDDYQLPELTFEDQTDPRTRGLQLYHQFCGTCHGRDGKGMDNIAPPLYESPYSNGPSEHLVLIALNGMHGPIEMDGKRYEFGAAMPGVKHNTMLSDEDIRDILLFVRNSFSSSHERITTEMVTELRQKTKDRTAMLTQEELDSWPIDPIQ